MKMFIRQLKEAIMPVHDEAEKRGPLKEIVSKTIKQDEYKKILERLYGFVFVSETITGPILSASDIDIEWNTRIRSPHLEKDLTFFGESESSIKSLPKCESLLNIKKPEEALGLVYLMEGSRLGGLVLAKALRQHFRFKNYQGYSYFSSNGTDMGPLWLSFQHLIQSYVEIHQSGDQIIESAVNNFKILNDWLNEY
ncbi:MAG: biliverdin-producing heme oxygenase [Desulfomonilaceae bacterium]